MEASRLKVLFDTNVLVDALRGLPAARDEIGRHTDFAISRVTWIEVLAGGRDAAERETLKAFLSPWPLIEIDARIAETAATLRREARLKLPDALVLATAKTNRRTLVTRDERDFSGARAAIRIPYRI
jgi:predicted nucleic acid-binding protein